VRTSRHRNTVLAAVVLVAAFTLAACGVSGADRALIEQLGDDDRARNAEGRDVGDPYGAVPTSAPPTTPPPPTEPPTTGSPVVVPLPTPGPPTAVAQTPRRAPIPATSTTTESARQRAVAAVSGKGQYLYRFERSGSVADIVRKATAHGLQHLVVRCGNSAVGFINQAQLRELLPAAHDVGIRVVCYDGPAMEDIPADIARAKAMIEFTAPGGHKIDAFASDIEKIRATKLDGPLALKYTTALRKAVGADYPLIAIVMNPNYHLDKYPFAEIATGFDVLCPMDYWTGVTDDGYAFVAESLRLLARFGRPVSVIGQAYPIEQKGTYPDAVQFRGQMQAAKDGGAVGVSFWAWEYTRPDSWQVIRDFGW
jgi:hypothetical protein